jgi:hypothetical protein
MAVSDIKTAIQLSISPAAPTLAEIQSIIPIMPSAAPILVDIQKILPPGQLHPLGDGVESKKVDVGGVSACCPSEYYKEASSFLSVISNPTSLSYRRM